MGVVGLATFLLSNRPEYHINPSWVVLPSLKTEMGLLVFLMMVEESPFKNGQNQTKKTVPICQKDEYMLC